MNIQNANIIDIELDSGTVHRSFCDKVICEGDNNANIYGFRCLRQNEPVSLAGCTCMGYFVKPDKTTVLIEGITDGNTAYVTLPDTCYAVVGQFSLAIKLYGGNVSGTIRIVDGTVTDTTTDSVIDPGGVLPDLEELLAVIGRAEDAAAAIESFVIDTEQISGDDYRLIISTSQGDE